MDDTISRQAAIEAVDRYLKRLEDKTGTSDDSEMFAHERGLLVGIKFDIDNIPPAEQQRKKGKWILIGKTHSADSDSDHDYQCSVCGHTDCHNVNVEVPYCWWCGAEMSEDADPSHPFADDVMMGG